MNGVKQFYLGNNLPKHFRGNTNFHRQKLRQLLSVEANFESYRMGNTKWTYHKERSLASNKFIVLKILFQ